MTATLVAAPRNTSVRRSSWAASGLRLRLAGGTTASASSTNPNLQSLPHPRANSRSRSSRSEEPLAHCRHRHGARRRVSTASHRPSARRRRQSLRSGRGHAEPGNRDYVTDGAIPIGLWQQFACYRSRTVASPQGTAIESGQAGRGHGRQLVETSGGAACGCTPVATNNAVFNASPRHHDSRGGPTIAGIDMTGFTGTLDTTASNWALTVNGRSPSKHPPGANSTVNVTGNVDVLTAGTVVQSRRVGVDDQRAWTNLSTPPRGLPGRARDNSRCASGTLTFAVLAGGRTSSTISRSMHCDHQHHVHDGGQPLRMGATLTIRNSTGGATDRPSLRHRRRTSASPQGRCPFDLRKLTANGSTSWSTAT